MEELRFKPSSGLTTKACGLLNYTMMPALGYRFTYLREANGPVLGHRQ